MKTIALFGGSFDPPHIGHEAIVDALAKLDYIDKIIVMPTFLNPFKSKSHAPSELRLKWLKEIFNGMKKVEVSSFEVNLKKKISTVQTVEMLKKRYQKIYVVIGADNLLNLHLWERDHDLQDMATFIVAPRDNIEMDPKYVKLNVEVSISSTRLRENIDISKLPKKCAQEIYNFYKEKNAK